MFVSTDLKLNEVSDSSELYAALRFAKGMIYLCKNVDITDNGKGVRCHMPRILIQNFEMGYYISYQHNLNGICYKYKAIGDKNDPNHFTINERDAEGMRFPKSLLVSQEKMLKCAEEFMGLMDSPDFGADIELPSCIEWVGKNNTKDDKT